MWRIFSALFWFFIAGLTIYYGHVNVILGIPMQVEGNDRYFFASFSILAGLLALFVGYEKEPEVYTCKICDDAFWEKNLKDGLCPQCGGEVKHLENSD